ncbi:translation initiation factor eIF-2B subunit epsilon, partial [Diplocarpon rosae]
MAQAQKSAKGSAGGGKAASKGKSKAAAPGKKVEDDREETLQAVVLADSFETRFNPFTIQTPRCLLPLANTPLIEYTLEFLAMSGVADIYIYCGAHTNAVERYIQASKWHPNFPASPFTKLEIVKTTASKDILGRWTYPLVPDSNLLAGQSYKFERGGLCKENGVILARTCKVGKRTVRRSEYASSDSDSSYAAAPTDPSVVGEGGSGYLFSDSSDDEDEATIFHNNLIYSTAHLNISTDTSKAAGVAFSSPGAENFLKEVAVGTDRKEEDQEEDQVDFISCLQKDLVHRSNGAVIMAASKGITPVFVVDPMKSRCLHYEEMNPLQANKYVNLDPELLIIGRRCSIGKNVRISNAYIWDDVVVRDGSTVNRAIIASEAVVGKNCKIQPGALLSYGVRIADNTEVKEASRYLHHLLRRQRVASRRRPLSALQLRRQRLRGWRAGVLFEREFPPRCRGRPARRPERRWRLGRRETGVHGNGAVIMAAVSQKLYQLEVLEEEAFLAWWEQSEGLGESEDVEMKKVRGKTGVFIEWLREAESEEESGSEEDDE